MAEELNTQQDLPEALNLRQAADSIASMDVDALFSDDTPSNRERSEGAEEEVEQPEIQDSADEEVTEHQQIDDDEEVEEVEASAEQTEDEESSEESEEPDIIQTIDQLAEAWDTPLEQVLEALQISVSGQDDPVNLKELRDGYLRQSDYTRSKQQLAEDRAGFDGEISAARQANERNNAVMATLFQQLEQAFLTPPDPAAMEQLRHDDPTEWSARREEFRDRQVFFQQILQGAAQNYDQQQSDYTQSAQQQLVTYIEGEKAKLLQAVPEWNEQTRSSLWDFVGSSYGFGPDEIQATIDSRTIRMALDAQKWHQSQATGQKAKKKLQAVPKMSKANTKKPRSKAQLNADNIRSLRTRARNSGSVRDAAKVIEATLGDL